MLILTVLVKNGQKIRGGGIKGGGITKLPKKEGGIKNVSALKGVNIFSDFKKYIPPHVLYDHSLSTELLRSYILKELRSYRVTVLSHLSIMYAFEGTSLV